ncbi:adenylosuccinate lyase [Muricauda sp. 334s03]|uniref:Adenylosuccinate lyase n=1 Tax=Flagellimonas yonaguniensis TaxID=3031325 RepID=A0ABT5XYS9_9FLAO|nr:adenylosuccinate lyase [[Muricauda] yonaguniensis]MDF0716248.1 adenylosuccinate lyase [[Muricauda] yonaguniensis]
MTEEQLHIVLNSGRISKSKIDGLVLQLEKKPQLALVLYHEVLLEDKEGTFNASWTFDHLMRKDPSLVLPFFDDFVNGLSELKTESCVRPIAHVCEMVCEAYFNKKRPEFVQSITDEQLEKIMTVCFDWLISSMNVAPKVFAMTSLYYLGLKFDWVHPELKLVLEKSYTSGTTGYKNRAKKTLDKLAKLGV